MPGCDLNGLNHCRTAVCGMPAKALHASVQISMHRSTVRPRVHPRMLGPRMPDSLPKLEGDEHVYSRLQDYLCQACMRSGVPRQALRSRWLCGVQDCLPEAKLQVQLQGCQREVPRARVQDELRAVQLHGR